VGEATKGGMNIMAIFRCFDDPEDGPFLKVHGITDDDLVKYIIDRTSGSKEDALARLVKGRVRGQADVDHVRKVVEQFPSGPIQ
jgi:hypothetical protein